MGKRGKGGGGGRGGGRRPRAGERADYSEINRHNEAFEKYYNELNIVDDKERDEFWTAMRRELPNSFRFAGSRGYAQAELEIK